MTREVVEKDDALAQRAAAGAPIAAIQELLGHKQVKTTQVYIKRKRSTKEGASHILPY